MSSLESASVEETVLKFSEIKRCVVCHRIFTPRRRLKLGWCKCGNGTLRVAGMLQPDDIREIEEDYGWEVTIDFEGKGYPGGNIDERLLPTGGEVRAEGKCDVPEAGLRQAKKEANRIDGIRRILSIKHWRKAVPERLRDVRSLKTKSQGTW